MGGLVVSTGDYDRKLRAIYAKHLSSSVDLDSKQTINQIHFPPFCKAACHEMNAFVICAFYRNSPVCAFGIRV